MNEILLDEVIAMLENVNGSIDYETEDGLVTKGLLSSFDILATISEAEEEFDIEIPAKDVIPENFNSAQALCSLMNRLADE